MPSTALPSSNNRRRGAVAHRSPSRDHSRGRRRSRASASPSAETSPEHGEKRARVDSEWTTSKKRVPDPYGLVAREVTRLVDMFWEPREVILAGIHLLSLDSQDDVDTEIASASDSKRKTYGIFKILCQKLPDIEEKLQGGREAWDDVHRRLEHGKTAAKTEDNLTFKQWVPSWYPWHPQLSRLKKSDRGLGHEECAMFLRPVTVDWTDENARHRFRVEQDPPLTADVWPALTYESNTADLDHLEVGLLRSNLMLQAGRAVLFPPSVANAQDPNNHKSNRQPKATTYGMTGVTTGFLAYVAVALRYTLSAEESFMESSGVFNYRVFYNDLVTYLEAPEFKTETRLLLDWWNERMFPPKRTPPSSNPSSMLARLRQQRERDATLNGSTGEAGDPLEAGDPSETGHIHEQSS